MKTRLYMSLAIIALLLSTGCASYRRNICDDFRDTVKSKVGVGPGLYVDAKVTSFLNPGLGWGGYWANLGLENRHTEFQHSSLNACPFPLGVIPGALPNESVLPSLRMANVRFNDRGPGDGEYAIVGQLFDLSAVMKWDAYGVQKHSPHSVFNPVQPTYTEQPLGVEAGVGILFVNARLGFDPVEFIDLLFTLCAIDILEDNTTGESSAPVDAEKAGATEP